MPFISFSCLITVAGTSNIMLNRNGESRDLCLVPDLSGKPFSFCLFCMISAVVSCIWTLLCWGMLTVLPVCWLFLSEMGAVPYQMLFPHLLLWSCDFCFSFYVMYYVYWFENIVPSLRTWNESTRSWCMMFLMCCWISFANIFSRISISMFISDTGL